MKLRFHEGFKKMAIVYQQIKSTASGDPADGTTYYTHVVALERLVAEKGLLAVAALDQRRHDWERAFRHTPHGQPVILADVSKD